jgi:rfaE bifunctional protein nucleotidyltransferase chain/domain
MFFEKIQANIKTRATAKEAVKQWQAAGGKVVFTNGCFDLLHLGHIHYLAQAKDLGTHLIIGVNSDQSVSRIKGPQRPIKDEQTRLHLLAALACVDAVVLFEEETPLELIENLLPDVLVKGGDWALDSIVGADIVLANGGTVHSLPFVEGFSTTNYVEKIKGESTK